METSYWNDQAKRLLKSELVRRGVSNDELVALLKDIGITETKASVDSKISRGKFSASFLLQCLNVIGCENFNPEISSLNIAAEPAGIYKRQRKIKVKSND
ncbi:DUF6471 domain-containing protein [Mucilaginibacter celer]|uniref:DUF6471 domain-containing protein n=1 Tax=Mucilaginibacter celer TaxID=2305508 RepID=UPI001968E47D|nr:DUF6471 domain-containing protein [Mucilaginibacter celer]